MWLKAFFSILSLIIHSEVDDDDIVENIPPAPEVPVINLHVLATSHIEAGWIHTFEAYYQGTSDPSLACARCVLDTVHDSLSESSERKYDLAEVSFFKRWWDEISQEKRDAFRRYVKNKQFEFINGGWVANDEACTYYDDIIDNIILGHRWLKDNLDADPAIGWQIDSYGSSATHSALLAQAGYEALLFSRADYMDRKTRISSKALQFNWEPLNPHNESIFTEMMYTQFSDLSWLYGNSSDCRSLFCKGELTTDQYEKITAHVNLQSESLATKNVLLLVSNNELSSDTNQRDFKKIEDLIKYYDQNSDLGIQARFSHLSNYVSQVQEDILDYGLSRQLPVKSDDFFPYIESTNRVWTGFFTSKPMYKRLIRQYSEYYNGVKLLLAKFMLLGDEDVLKMTQDQHGNIDTALNSLEESLSLVQHHESITGTMREKVRVDYENKLIHSKKKVEDILQSILLQYLEKSFSEELTVSNVGYDWFYKDQNYKSVFQEGKTLTVAIFNPGHTRDILQRIKVPSVGYKIINKDGATMQADIICHSKDMASDCYLYFNDIFKAYDIQVYKVVAIEDGKALDGTTIGKKGIELKSETQGKTLFIDGNLLDLTFTYCTTEESCTSDSFNLDYKYYVSSTAIDDDRVPSGAYIFSPKSKKRWDFSSPTSGRVFKGKAFTLVQIFRDGICTEILLFNDPNNNHLEITSYLDPITDTTNGKEIILLVKSQNINSNDIFFTDANGYFTQKRQRDHRDTHELNAISSVARNYYPITSSIFIEDVTSTQRLSLITDRAQGASSLNSGEVEVMIHRVTPKDDLQGLDEPLQERDLDTGEPIKVITRHFLEYSQPSKGVSDQRRKQQYELDRALQVWFYNSDSSAIESCIVDNDKGASQPDNVKISVRSYRSNEYIVRVHNLREDLSAELELFDPVTKSCSILNSIVGQDVVKINSVHELSWTTTKSKSDIKPNRLDRKRVPLPDVDQSDLSVISLVPMEIRTFKFVLKVKEILIDTL